MRRGIMRRSAGYGLALLVAGLVGCRGFSFGGRGTAATPDESIENLVPDSTAARSSHPPSAEIRTPAELAARQGQSLPKDRYAPSPPSENLHKVQRGETLFGLARRYYGDQRQWRRIYQANRNRIPDPQKIRAGMKLIIP